MKTAAALVLVALSAASAAGCAEKRTPPEPGRHVHAASSPATITFLYTADEHGWLLPTERDGELRGGAAQMLGQWIVAEGHCPGGEQTGALSLHPACEDPATVALSGGDNYTGPAISSFELGAPMARAMGRMGYAASAFGNHEYDFGRAAFVRNRKLAGMPYLAANMLPDHDSTGAAPVRSVVIERKGFRIAIVGGATEETPIAAMATLFEGIAFESLEASLGAEIDWLHRQDAYDALVIIAHECTDVLAPMLERNPQWNPLFVGGAHCHKEDLRDVRGIPVVAPGWALRKYGRIEVTMERDERGMAVPVSRAAELVPVSQRIGTPSPRDGLLGGLVADASRELDLELGQTLAQASTGIPRDSQEMFRWIGGAMLAETRAELAILNEGGIRQDLGAGNVRTADVHSVIPFINQVVLVTIQGEDLPRLVEHEGARTVGASWHEGRLQIGDQPVEPGRAYRVATLDYLYFGGDRFPFRELDPNPEGTGRDWRDVVCEWTERTHGQLSESLAAGLPVAYGG